MTKNLNDAQKDELIAQYSQLIVDSMDIESLEQFVYNTLAEDFGKLSESTGEKACKSIRSTED